MSSTNIGSQITRIKTNIQDAFSVIELRGGVVADRNSNALSSAIQTIPSGSSSNNGSTLFGFELGKDWIASESINFRSTKVRWITSGPDKFVAVGSDRLLLYSEDGIIWTAGEMPYDTNYNTHYDYVCFVNDRYIAANTSKRGNRKVFAHSFDGINWSDSESDICYANGLYIGVDTYSESPIISEDGVYWKKLQNDDLDGYVNGLAYANGNFIFTNGSQRIYVTSDLETITTFSWSSPIGGLTNIASYNNVVVCGGTRYYVVSMDGGETWETIDLREAIETTVIDTAAPTCIDNLWMFIAAGVTTGAPGHIFYTKDFVHWGRANYPNYYTDMIDGFSGMAYGADKLLLAICGMKTPLVSFGSIPTDI